MFELFGLAGKNKLKTALLGCIDARPEQRRRDGKVAIRLRARGNASGMPRRANELLTNSSGRGGIEWRSEGKTSQKPKRIGTLGGALGLVRTRLAVSPSSTPNYKAALKWPLFLHPRSES